MKGAIAMDWGSIDTSKLITGIGTALGYIAAATVIAIVTFYKIWGKVKIDSQTTSSEVGALQLLDKAVEHWKDLNTEAWAQVKKERELRIEAERRADVMMQEMEDMRSEIAALKREVHGLRNVMTTSQNLQPPTPGVTHG